MLVTFLDIISFCDVWDKQHMNIYTKDIFSPKRHKQVSNNFFIFDFYTSHVHLFMEQISILCSLYWQGSLRKTPSCLLDRNLQRSHLMGQNFYTNRKTGAHFGSAKRKYRLNIWTLHPWDLLLATDEIPKESKLQPCFSYKSTWPVCKYLHKMIN